MACKRGGVEEAVPCPCPVGPATLPGELYLAARGGDLGRVRRYLEDGHDLNASDADGCTLLASACLGGQVMVVRLLQRQPHLHRNTRDLLADTPLMHAAATGHHALVRELLTCPHQCCLDVAAVNKYDETALDLARVNGHAEVVKMLQEFRLPQVPTGVNDQGRLIVKPSMYVEVKLECEVCLEEYDKNHHRARILSCGHSLCTSCVAESLKLGPLRCPFCRAHHVPINAPQVTAAGEVPVNYTLDSLVQD